MRLRIELQDERITLRVKLGRPNKEDQTTRAGLWLECTRRGRLRQAAAFAREVNVAGLIEGDRVQSVVTRTADVSRIVETTGGIEAREVSVIGSTAEFRLQGVRGDGKIRRLSRSGYPGVPARIHRYIRAVRRPAPAEHCRINKRVAAGRDPGHERVRSEEHTSELQSPMYLV